MKRFIVKKIISPGRIVDTQHKYMVVNVDEPYAKKVFQLIKKHEQEKGTWDGPPDFKGFVNLL